MDFIERVEEDEVISLKNGRHALLDWRGVHPIPNSTIVEEIRRSPYDTWLNRRNRAIALKKKGKIREAEKARQEASFLAKHFGFPKRKKKRRYGVRKRK